MNELPTTFGKYYLAEKLAVGGMAEIYLAKIIGPGGFEKPIIIKQIHPELSDQPQFVDLFVTEAKTLVSLTHGNIVPIYELGVVDDRYFIAMEYIDGPTLSELGRAVRDAGERIAPPVAAYIAAELLKGLDYAHRKGDGVIHRDLSPRNVMISRDGEVKLVDFGIALTLDQEQVTRKGRPEGSLPYMSPEQARSEPLTAQSDLFSAGILLWEMLTGRPLFLRDDADSTLRAVLEDEIALPSETCPEAEIPEALDEICRQALARDPAERFAAAGRLSMRLNRYLYSQETPVGPAVLSRLVARHCPPVVRRERGGEGESEGDSDGGGAVTPAVTPVAGRDAAIGQTVPLERRQADGKKRRAGTQTFATSVAFETEVLPNATPLFPIAAIRDDDEIEGRGARGEEREARGEEREARGEERGARGEKRGARGESEERGARDQSEERGARDESERGSRRGWVAALLGMVLIAGGVVGYVAWPGSEGNAAVVVDAGVAVTFDAAVPDAGVPDAVVVDAGVPDARGRTVVRKRIDAGVKPRGTARLKVGANPWGEVYLDGKRLGRAPGEWTIPSGRHQVEVRFPVPGREQSKRFRINVRAGGAESLGVVDFTGR